MEICIYFKDLGMESRISYFQVFRNVKVFTFSPFLIKVTTFLFCLSPTGNYFWLYNFFFRFCLWLFCSIRKWILIMSWVLFMLFLLQMWWMMWRGRRRIRRYGVFSFRWSWKRSFVLKLIFVKSCNISFTIKLSILHTPFSHWSCVSENVELNQLKKKN